MSFEFCNDNSLIIIPARSGSKRVRGKNIKLLNKKPLINYSIEQCLKLKNVEILVSTNDEKIFEICEQYNLKVPFERPDYLCQDNSSSRSVIIHALSFYFKKYKKLPYIVGLKPPTNPFIKASTIEKMIKKLELSNENINSCVSISEAKTHPFRVVNLNREDYIKNGVISIDNRTINDIERSQDWPEAWEGSPALRLSKVKYFYKEIKNEIFNNNGKTYDPNNSLGFKISKIEAFDIDDEFDFKFAEAVSSIK
tara:strand:+ start:668 stop:1426 length:759 start_codon:yes stop_codon:yes gene_type:complete